MNYMEVIGIAIVLYFAFFDIYVIYEYTGQNSKQVPNHTASSLKWSFYSLIHMRGQEGSSEHDQLSYVC